MNLKQLSDKNYYHLLGCEALWGTVDPLGRAKVARGIITGVDEHATPWPELLVTPKGCKKERRFKLLGVTVLVPKADIPEPWKPWLELNRGLAVCIEFAADPIITELVDPKTLRRAECFMVTEETASLRLWSNSDTVSTGKPCIEGGDREYRIGSRLLVEPDVEVDDYS